jgi:hypothetical protein
LRNDGYKNTSCIYQLVIRLRVPNAPRWSLSQFTNAYTISTWVYIQCLYQINLVEYLICIMISEYAPYSTRCLVYTWLVSLLREPDIIVESLVFIAMRLCVLAGLFVTAVCGTASTRRTVNKQTVLVLVHCRLNMPTIPHNTFKPSCGIYSQQQTVCIAYHDYDPVLISHVTSSFFVCQIEAYWH